MDALSKNRKKHILQFAFASILFGLWTCVVYVKCGIYFETNDDRIITEILSGVLAVNPEFHTTYVNALLSAVFAALYGLTTAIPWYGGCLILFHVSAYVLFLYFLLRRANGLWEAIGAVVMAGSFVLVNVGLLAQIQYTSTAALLALTGYACLVLEDDEKCGFVVFAVMELLAILLRDQAMLMIQPLGLPVFVLWILIRKDLIFGQKIKKIAEVCAVLLALFVVMWVGTTAAYGSGDWKNYKLGDNASRQIFDYGDRMSYEEAMPVLDKYGVTEVQYNAYMSYTMLDGEISTECLQELVEFRKSIYEKHPSVGELFTEQLAYLQSDSFRGLNKVVLLLWILLTLYILISREFSVLIPMVGLLAGRLFVWGFLIYGGRVPQRVLAPLFACEMMLLLVLFVRCYVTGEPQEKKPLIKYFATRIFVVIFLLLFAARSVESGKEQYRYAAQQNRGQEIFFAGAKELQDYCGQHPERQYYVESLSQAYYVGSALETEYYLHRDYMTTGCWYFNSPAMNAKTEAFRNEREEGIYLIIYAYADSEGHPAVLYFEEKTNVKPVQTDSFTLSHGGRYLVYYFGEAY